MATGKGRRVEREGRRRCLTSPSSSSVRPWLPPLSPPTGKADAMGKPTTYHGQRLAAGMAAASEAFAKVAQEAAEQNDAAGAGLAAAMAHVFAEKAKDAEAAVERAAMIALGRAAQ